MSLHQRAPRTDAVPVVCGQRDALPTRRFLKEIACRHASGAMRRPPKRAGPSGAGAVRGRYPRGGAEWHREHSLLAGLTGSARSEAGAQNRSTQAVQPRKVGKHG